MLITIIEIVALIVMLKIAMGLIGFTKNGPIMNKIIHLSSNRGNRKGES